MRIITLKCYFLVWIRFMRMFLVFVSILFYKFKSRKYQGCQVCLFHTTIMCSKNHQLSYKCRQLKSAGKINSTWFWNNSINVKLNERSQPMKIHHVIDIENLIFWSWQFRWVYNNTSFSNLTDLMIFSFNLFSTFSSSLTLFLSINCIT